MRKEAFRIFQEDYNLYRSTQQDIESLLTTRDIKKMKMDNFTPLRIRSQQKLRQWMEQQSI